ncbi:EAL domain-containing protein [Legionella maioricensis]|uniref:EAL domain-containing protein n=1 Tax=Legionella maioricensis TaxID=2896528 RepID=A0A9X2D0G1_9GAMM|nr:EAL domain-containing protein [Legionella maioricensis]MCL9684295.1 EAL domain-containing protein [Legionella maioricensis]MCL9687161.1 EAL domain-containing protein [Legionella maioricensis]
MSKLFQQSSLIIYKRFTFLWVLITLLVLLVALYRNWQISLEKSYQNISETAIKLSNNTDRLIEDLFQEIYTLPAYEKNFSDCQEGLAPYLERIPLNDPKIAGLVVSDNTKLLCSTLSDTTGLVLSHARPRSISGPYNLSIFDQPVYFIQQKMGHYDIGILVLSSTIKNVLYPLDDSVNAVALYDNSERKTILRIERNPERSGWIFNNNQEDLSLQKDQSLFAVDKLYSIDGVKVMVFKDENTTLRHLGYRETLVSLTILIISCLLYFITKNFITKRYSLLGAMKSALKNKEFYPTYQPLFDKEKKKYAGVEVLLRWQDKKNQIIMPDLFIEEAEANGLIVPITLQIIEIAFNQTKALLNNYPDFHLAFNISALHFTDPTFFNKFNLLVEQYVISPTQIIFEITERDLLDKNNGIFFDKMRELRQAGFSLAVDDYGTGHASISYLHHFPFNYLKIDKLFIQAIGTKAITESLNDAIINMAKRLNLIIIAEGVETEEQVNYLSENGVRFLQGWYFSRALSIEKLFDLLQGEENESQL